MGNPPHQAGLSILRSWPNDRNVGRTRIALIGGTREGKSPMLDVQNLQRPDPNHPPTDYLIPLRNKMKIRAKKFGECEATNFVTSNKLCWFVWAHEKPNSKSRGVHQRYMSLKPVNDQIYDFLGDFFCLSDSTLFEAHFHLLFRLKNILKVF